MELLLEELLHFHSRRRPRPRTLASRGSGERQAPALASGKTSSGALQVRPDPLAGGQNLQPNFYLNFWGSNIARRDTFSLGFLLGGKMFVE